jgi:hypothetical protein
MKSTFYEADLFSQNRGASQIFQNTLLFPSAKLEKCGRDFRSFFSRFWALTSKIIAADKAYIGQLESE